MVLPSRSWQSRLGRIFTLTLKFMSTVTLDKLTVIPESDLSSVFKLCDSGKFDLFSTHLKCARRRFCTCGRTSALWASLS